ncbi:CagZ [Helicobacter pylori GAM96Ai]|uniref:cag pathogenicity island translocation protein CagZ n=1 Tax=Helicobacter pylori TaxID=210 RepID=UPI0002BAD2A5|nr:cag pathogenicity island translocation protein CagZ [Helicobacter pylori]EMH44877.1 CagZ [Helicobacter pylori GAM96Ai]
MELGFKEIEQQKILNSQSGLIANAYDAREIFANNYLSGLKDVPREKFLEVVQQLQIHLGEHLVDFNQYAQYLRNIVSMSYDRCYAELVYAERTIEDALKREELILDIANSFNNFTNDHVFQISNLVASYVSSEYLPTYIDGNLKGVMLKILGIDDFGNKINEIIQDIGTKYSILSKNKRYLTSLERAKLKTKLNLK